MFVREASCEIADFTDPEGGKMDGEEVAAVVTAEWQRVLNTTETDPQGDFFELGGNSLTAADMIVAVEERLDIEFPVETLFMDGTFGEVLKACQEVIGATPAERLHSQ